MREAAAPQLLTTRDDDRPGLGPLPGQADRLVLGGLEALVLEPRRHELPLEGVPAGISLYGFRWVARAPRGGTGLEQ